MPRITKLRVRFQSAAGLAAAFLITGCACGAVPPPLTPPSEAGLPIGDRIGRTQLAESVQVFRTGPGGNTFTAVLPVRAQPLDLPSVELLNGIGPVLAAVGFQRSLTDLAIPAQPLLREAPDLRSLAVEMCREPALLENPGSRAICGALIDGAPSPLADEAIRGAYGVSFAEWKTGLARPQLEYPFAQVVAGVPIESTGVFIVRSPGESPSLVYGTLLNVFSVVNQVNASARDAVLGMALARLGQQMKDALALLPVAPVLVLVPDGTSPAPDGTPVPILRYAWRVLVGRERGAESWMAWFDAANGALLRISDQAKDATEVAGVRWRRDPGPCLSKKPCTENVRFYVDLANNKLALQLNNVFQRIEVHGQSYLELAAGSAGFDQPPVNDAASAVCGTDSAFRQVNAYSHLYSFWNLVNGAKIGQPFPENPLRVVVDDPDKDNVGSSAYYDSLKKDALSSLWLSAGSGFKSARCPDAVDVRLNGAQDATVMAHEMSHLLVQRLQERRQCATPCSLPDVLGHNILHDFADGLAAFYTSTNCFAGWSAKNMGKADATLNCKGLTSEAGGFPRLASLPMDRFPDHRTQDKGEYANGQIAAAALWEVREGVRSKSLTGGTLQAWERTLSAIQKFGFMPPTCKEGTKAVWDSSLSRNRYKSCDRDVFLYLQDLEAKMVGAWLSGGEPAKQTVSKVLSGWAKAGIFLVPSNCLDNKPGTRDLLSCSDQDTALDAVIEIDDRNTGDDPKDVDGAVHPEVDYLNAPPRFRIWTGPSYFFPSEDATGNTNGCGNRYQIEVASDEKFQTNLWTSGSRSTDTPCEGSFDLYRKLPDTIWNALAAQGRLYYRVRTWDGSGHMRVSTQPAAGAIPIPPPFATINSSGKP